MFYLSQSDSSEENDDVAADAKQHSRDERLAELVAEAERAVDEDARNEQFLARDAEARAQIKADLAKLRGVNHPPVETRPACTVCWCALSYC